MTRNRPEPNINVMEVLGNRDQSVLYFLNLLYSALHWRSIKNNNKYIHVFTMFVIPLHNIRVSVCHVCRVYCVSMILLNNYLERIWIRKMKNERWKSLLWMDLVCTCRLKCYISSWSIYKGSISADFNAVKL